MSKPTKALISTAYHEAGHAVAAIVKGIKVEKATIKPDKDYLGVVIQKRIQKSVRDALEYGSPTPAKRERIEIHAIILLAGGIAERKYRGRYNHIGRGEDVDKVIDIALKLSGSTNTTNAYLQWLHCCAV